MGVSVADLERRRKVTRCPVESPPGAIVVKVRKTLDGNEDTFTLTTANDDTLLADAAISFAAFDSSATTILGTWYTDLRTSVTVDSVTYNERKELWKVFTETLT